MPFGFDDYLELIFLWTDFIRAWMLPKCTGEGGIFYLY